MVKTIEQRVKSLLADHLGVSEEKLTPDADLQDDLGADSLDKLELIMAFEEEFECEIPDEQAETIKTVQDAVNLITTKEQ